MVDDPSTEKSVNTEAKTSIKPKPKRKIISSSKKTTKVKRKPSSRATAKSANVQYPKHPVEAALRIPRAILEQNAGKECSEVEAAGFLGVRLSGSIRVELSSARKYGFLDRPSPGRISITELAKKVLRPQKPNEKLEGFREAVLNAPVISDVYKHYRGENLPDQQFFDNTLVDTFKVPASDLSEFKEILIASLGSAELFEEHGGKFRVLDVAQQGTLGTDTSDTLRKLGKAVSISATDTCFVVMPFAIPLGNNI